MCVEIVHFSMQPLYYLSHCSARRPEAYFQQSGTTPIFSHFLHPFGQSGMPPIMPSRVLPDPVDKSQISRPNHEKSIISVGLGRFSYRRPKCSDCKDCDGTSLKDRKGEPWSMVLRGSPYKELQMLCGGKISDWEQKLSNWPLVRCDICNEKIENNSPRWVCESSVDMNNTSDTYEYDNVHRNTMHDNDKIKTSHEPVRSVCTYCISTDGVVECGICGEQKESRKNRGCYSVEKGKLEYATPCAQCKYPVCKFCLIEWSNRCRKNAQETTCPFCRTKYNHYTMKTAGWETSSLRAGDKSNPQFKFERTPDAVKKIEDLLGKMGVN